MLALLITTMAATSCAAPTTTTVAAGPSGIVLQSRPSSPGIVVQPDHAGPLIDLQGATVHGPIALGLAPSTAERVRRVRYVVDGGRTKLVSPAAWADPFTVGLDTARLAPGRHVVRAELSTSDGSRVRSAAFEVKPADQLPSAGTTSDAPQPYPTRVAAAYQTIFPNPTSPALSDLPANLNVVNLAFAEGKPLGLMAGPRPTAALAADVRSLRARGVRVVLSIGGADGTVDVRDRAAFVRDVLALSDVVPLDGIDWDVEGDELPLDDVVAVSTELKSRRGQAFAITMAPNGSTIDQYAVVAGALQRAGALDMIGQQFYDAPVTVDAAAGRIRQLLAAGVPEDKIAIGMMIGEGDHYWTVAECVDNTGRLLTQFPRLRGGYLWETGRPGTGEWAARVAPLLTGPSDAGWTR